MAVSSNMQHLGENREGIEVYLESKRDNIPMFWMFFFHLYQNVKPFCPPPAMYKQLPSVLKLYFIIIYLHTSKRLSGFKMESLLN